MGCCIGLKNEILADKEIIINLGHIKEDFIISSDKITNKEQNWINSDEIKYRKVSFKAEETIRDENISKTKKREKIVNTYPKRIKDTAKNLRLITIVEVRNIHKFFALK